MKTRDPRNTFPAWWCESTTKNYTYIHAYRMSDDSDDGFNDINLDDDDADTQETNTQYTQGSPQDSTQGRTQDSTQEIPQNEQEVLEDIDQRLQMLAETKKMIDLTDQHDPENTLSHLLGIQTATTNDALYASASRVFEKGRERYNKNIKTCLKKHGASATTMEELDDQIRSIQGRIHRRTAMGIRWARVTDIKQQEEKIKNSLIPLLGDGFVPKPDKSVEGKRKKWTRPPVEEISWETTGGNVVTVSSRGPPKKKPKVTRERLEQCKALFVNRESMEKFWDTTHPVIQEVQITAVHGDTGNYLDFVSDVENSKVFQIPENRVPSDKVFEILKTFPAGVCLDSSNEAFGVLRDAMWGHFVRLDLVPRMETHAGPHMTKDQVVQISRADGTTGLFIQFVLSSGTVWWPIVGHIRHPPSHEARCSSAARHAIRGQVDDFREGAFCSRGAVSVPGVAAPIPCSACGCMVTQKFHRIHIDHYPEPFSTLWERFVSSGIVGVQDPRLVVTINSPSGAFMLAPSADSAWKQFHAKHASLRVTCRLCNLAAGKHDR